MALRNDLAVLKEKLLECALVAYGDMPLDAETKDPAVSEMVSLAHLIRQREMELAALVEDAWRDVYALSARDHVFYKMGPDLKWVRADPPQATAQWVRNFGGQHRWHDSKDYLYATRVGNRFIHEIDKKTGEVRQLQSQHDGGFVTSGGGHVWGCGFMGAQFERTLFRHRPNGWEEFAELPFPGSQMVFLDGYIYFPCMNGPARFDILTKKCEYVPAAPSLTTWARVVAASDWKMFSASGWCAWDIYDTKTGTHIKPQLEPGDVYPADVEMLFTV
jgi:hypothetical protein